MINVASCRSCSASIVWMKTSKGKNIPVDANTVREDDLELVFDPKSRSTDNRIPKFDPKKHTAHFATCPNAERHRRAR